MKSFTAFLVILGGFLVVQLGECVRMSMHPLRVSKEHAPIPSHNSTGTNSNGNGVLEIIQEEKGDSVLKGIVEVGVQKGLDECQKLFENETWNCPEEMYNKLPIVGNTALPYATRETAFIHAISSAAITHEITYICKISKMPGCNCPKPFRQPKEHLRRGISLGKCGDNIEFGEKKAKLFTDRLEKGSPAIRAINLHNNEVGRQVVQTSARIACKCHGFNTACELKTCWKELAPFEVVSSKLKQKYDNAVRVWFVDNKLQERVNNQLVPVSSSDPRLVYLDSSPDFCVGNDTLGTPGMLGQSCRSDEAADKCQSFIDYCKSCSLRVETEEREKQVKCHCMFKWCCTVECDTCTKKYSVMTCSD